MKTKIKAFEVIPKTHGEIPDDFVKIKAGSFLMGSNANGSNEKPVHKVTISYDYYMCDHEVTKEEYKTIMGTFYPIMGGVIVAASTSVFSCIAAAFASERHRNMALNRPGYVLEIRP